MVIGLCRAFNGLSASIFTQIYVGLFKPDATSFLLFMSIFLFSLAFISGLHINEVGEKEAQRIPSSARIKLGYFLTAFLAFYLLATDLIQDADSLRRSSVLVITTCMFLFLGMIPLVILGGEGDTDAGSESDGEQDAASREGLLSWEEGDDDLIQTYEGPSQAQAQAKASREFTALRCLAALDFWLLFLGGSAGTGAALMLINNIGELSVALGGATGEETTFISLISISNCFGRLVAGYISDRYVHVAPRPVFFASGLMMMSVSHFFLSIASFRMLYIASILVGFSFGFFWLMLPAIASDLFGNKHMGVNYNLLTLGPPIGSLLLSDLLAGSAPTNNTNFDFVASR